MNYSTSIKTVCCIAIKVLILLSLNAPAAAETNAIQQSIDSIPAELISHKPKQYDASLAISVSSVLYKLKQKQPIALVDIRTAHDFGRLKIPGSLNISLHAVKTKAFLKTASVVLINKGYGYALLEAECERLKALGFKVSILEGGLPAWHRKGGALVGDLWALQDMKKISPQTFFKEKDFVNGLVIEISPVRSPESKKLIPRAKHMPFLSDPGGWVSDLKTALKGFQNEAFFSVLLVDKNGDHYGDLERIVEKIETDVFYLNGGLSAYRSYLQYLMRSWQPREDRIKTVGQCRNCGRAQKKVPRRTGQGTISAEQ